MPSQESQDVRKFTPVSYRISVLWGCCPALTPLLQLIIPSRASGTADHVQSLDDQFSPPSRDRSFCIFSFILFLPLDLPSVPSFFPAFLPPLLPSYLSSFLPFKNVGLCPFRHVSLPLQLPQKLFNDELFVYHALFNQLSLFAPPRTNASFDAARCTYIGYE